MSRFFAAILSFFQILFGLIFQLLTQTTVIVGLCAFGIVGLVFAIPYGLFFALPKRLFGRKKLAQTH